jgi:hypothetical protein
VHSVKSRAHQNPGENAISRVQGTNAQWQIRIKKDGHRAQILNVGQ